MVPCVLTRFARQWQFMLTQKLTSQMFRHPRHMATHNNTTTVFLSILKMRRGRLGLNSDCQKVSSDAIPTGLAETYREVGLTEE